MPRDKKEWAEYMKQWRRKNADKVNARNRERRATEPDFREKNRIRSAAYAAANQEKNVERAKAWQQANREKRRAYLKAYHAKKEKGDVARARTKAWVKANPEKRKVNARHYSGRRRQKTALAPAKEVANIKAYIARERRRKFHRCYYCQGRFTGVFHVDHIQALANGGAHDSSNIATACPACNLSKAAKPVAEVVVGGQPLLTL